MNPKGNYATMPGAINQGTLLVRLGLFTKVRNGRALDFVLVKPRDSLDAQEARLPSAARVIGKTISSMRSRLEPSDRDFLLALEHPVRTLPTHQETPRRIKCILHELHIHHLPTLNPAPDTKRTACPPVRRPCLIGECPKHRNISYAVFAFGFGIAKQSLYFELLILPDFVHSCECVEDGGGA